jgi:translation initiation factor eIF-2B subunit delta
MQVIQAYTTPPGVALSRHLTTHLSHQISHLSHSRPLSVSQGNSIRWLKKLITALDISLSDSEAISFLCSSIDGFIREKITLADELIAEAASAKIANGDVILTYAKSSVVEKTLLKAHGQGKRFKVIVVDSRPLFEGKNSARSLTQTGLDVQYCLISGLSNVARQVTKCFLGASAIMGNGRLYSRAGTALVAMVAKEGRESGLGDTRRANGLSISVPVIVLCESIKFTSRVALDSVVGNELGDADALVELDDSEILTSTVLEPVAATSSGKGSKKGNKNNAEDDDSADAAKHKKGLEGWEEQVNLQLLNLMYDVTPAEFLDMVITELGSLPPSGVPVVNGVWGGEE